MNRICKSLVFAAVLFVSVVSAQRAQAQFYSMSDIEGEVVVNGGNGFGSANTIVRRFSNVQLTIGTAVTYADDSVYGASFLINAPGVYSISYTDQRTDNAFSGFLYYIEVDHSPVQSTVSTILSGTTLTTISTSTPVVIGKNNVTLLLDAGDVVRPWWFGNSGGTYNDLQSQFIITKVR